MDGAQTLLAGVKAAGMGSLIGTGLPTLITMAVGVSLLSDGIGGGLFFMFMPFLIGFAAAGIGLVLVGLPVTLWLKKRGKESRRAYLSGGLIGGGVVALGMSALLFGEIWGATAFFAAFGALTGGATGHFWWRYARQAEVEADFEQIAEVFG